MSDNCVVCNKVLVDSEGFVSSNGAVVCSEECKHTHMKSLPNEGKSQLTVFSRVTGYYTPVSSWNRGKLQEHKERKVYRMNEVN